MENFVVSARKYRPVGFEEVVGQEHITTTLHYLKYAHVPSAMPVSLLDNLLQGENFVRNIAD